MPAQDRLGDLQIEGSVMRDEADLGVGREEGRNILAGHEDALPAVACGGQHQGWCQVGAIVVDEGGLGVVGKQPVKDAALIGHPDIEGATMRPQCDFKHGEFSLLIRVGHSTCP